jgi:hypothetical protein
VALPASRNYLALSGFLFLLFLCASDGHVVAFDLAESPLGWGGMAVGTVFAANSVGAMCAQPLRLRV